MPTASTRPNGASNAGSRSSAIPKTSMSMSIGLEALGVGLWALGIELLQQLVAHPATDDQRAPAVVAHGAREVADHAGSCSTVHASIIPRMASSTDPAIALLRDLVAIDSVNPSLVAGRARRGRRRAADCRRARGDRSSRRDHRRRARPSQRRRRARGAGTGPLADVLRPHRYRRRQRHARGRSNPRFATAASTAAARRT